MTTGNVGSGARLASRRGRQTGLPQRDSIVSSFIRLKAGCGQDWLPYIERNGLPHEVVETKAQ